MSTGRTVLVVDDDVLALRATSRSLRGRGYDVISVPTMRAALRAPGPFACAIVDVNLDTDSGLDLGRELLRTGAATSLVFFSGSADFETREAAEQLGVFVNKASDFDLLLRAVEQCFGPESGHSGVIDVPDSRGDLPDNGSSGPPPIASVRR